MFFAEFLLILAICIGLGNLIPAPSNDFYEAPGYLSFVGVCLLVNLLYVFIVIAGLSFSTALAGVSTTAIMGWIFWYQRARLTLSVSGSAALSVCIHPLVFLPLIIVGVGLAWAPVSFLPYGDDTYANWLSHAKQIWLVNDFWFPGMMSAALGYPPGWHLLLAFSGGFWGGFVEVNALAAPMVFHITLLAMVFDLSRVVLRRRFELGHWTSSGLALFAILFLLAVEGAWKLLPTLILSEMPLFYSAIGVILMLVIFWLPGALSWRVAVAIGIGTSAHYLLKSQGLALVPLIVTAVFVSTFITRTRASPWLAAAGGFAVLAALPVLVEILTWKIVSPASMKCSLNVGQILSGGLAEFGRPGSSWITIGRDLLIETSSYLWRYKLPVSILALIGLCWGLTRTYTRWLCLAVVGYACIYLTAIYVTYVGCPDGFNAYLSSLTRYLQLPVRVLHFIGIWVLIVTVIDLGRRMDWDQFRKPAWIGGITVIAILTLNQLSAVNGSYKQMASPAIGSRMAQFVSEIPGEVEEVLRVAAATKTKRPRVLMIYAYWELFPYLVARHHGFPDRHADLPDAAQLGETPEPDSISRWRLEHARFAVREDLKPVEGTLNFNLVDYDVIWLRDPIHSVLDRLRPLLSSRECANAPDTFYLVKSRKVENSWTCVPRNTPLRKR